MNRQLFVSLSLSLVCILGFYYLAKDDKPIESKFITTTTTTSNAGNASIWTDQPIGPMPDLIIINTSSEAMVTIHPDGRIDISPNANVNDAALIFWEAVSANAPCRCEQNAD